MKRVLWSAIGLSALAAGGWWLAMRHFTEQPSYAVQKVYDDFEVREVAGASQTAFRILAGYIFGKNDDERKVAMTTPVDMQPSDSKMEHWTMPSEFDLESLPKPQDERIRLRRADRSTFVAMRFSGDPTAEEVSAKMDALRAAAAREGIEVSGEPVYASYDPPSTPALLRRNEIMFEVPSS